MKKKILTAFAASTLLIGSLDTVIANATPPPARVIDYEEGDIIISRRPKENPVIAGKNLSLYREKFAPVQLDSNSSTDAWRRDYIHSVVVDNGTLVHVMSASTNVHDCPPPIPPTTMMGN